MNSVWPICPVIWPEKRVTIASILVLGAEIILLDEPTAGQDQKNYTEIMGISKSCIKRSYHCHDYP